MKGRTARLFGYQRHELLDQAVEVLVPDRFRAHHGAHRAGYSADPRVRAMGSGLELLLREIHHRVKNNLQIDTFGRVHVHEYLRALALQVRGSHAADAIPIAFEMEPVTVDLDRAIPCGLITTELLSNCFKHAFRDRSGQVRLRFRRDSNGLCVLHVIDDGGGLPPTQNMERSSTLGFKLVRSLARQLAGTLDVESGMAGTTVSLSFPGE